MRGNGIKLYKNDEGNYVLELWGASTKHPDSVFHMEDFKFPYWADRNDPAVVDGQVMQWLLECASRLTFPPYAKALAEYALEEWGKMWE
jgi:hypothetical protein